MLEPGRAPSAQSLELFFDYTCPFAYLAWTQARALATRMGVSLTPKPMLLGGVFRAVGTPQNLSGTLGAAKAAHTSADMQRWAKRFGVPLTMPPQHPMRSVDALRATLACGIDPRVVDGFYAAYWRDNRDIAEPAVIAGVLEAAGMDAKAVMDTAASQAVKDDLRARTEEAIARGVFGVPTIFVDREHMYWGQDRFDFVEGWSERRGRGERAPHAPGRVVRFYWDFSSPFAYLAAIQMEGLAARTGATIEWRPVLLGGLFRSIGTAEVPIATFSPAKQRFVGKDLERWAFRLEAPYRWPSRFPMKSLLALRVWLALPEPHRMHYALNVFRAAWGEDRDIEDPKVLAACIGDAALATDALARAASDEVKGALRASTEEAQARGVFGVPTFVLGDELYWGQDRIGLVEEALAT